MTKNQQPFYRGFFKSYVLCFVPLWESHSGPLLLQKYEKFINTFGIKDKVIHSVIDGVVNYINIYRDLTIPGFAQYFIQTNNDEMNHEYEEVGLNDEYSPNIPSSTTTNSTSIESVREDFIRNSFRSLVVKNEVLRIPCFAHIMQLIVKDGLKETMSILSSLGKVSAMAKLSHTNTKFVFEFT